MSTLWQAVNVLFIASDMGSCGGRVVWVMMMVVCCECGEGMCVQCGASMLGDAQRANGCTLWMGSVVWFDGMMNRGNMVLGWMLRGEKMVVAVPCCFLFVFIKSGGWEVDVGVDLSGVVLC